MRSLILDTPWCTKQLSALSKATGLAVSLQFPSKQLYHNTAYWMDMANDNTIKNLIILALAVIIVIAIWRAIWYLAGVAVFILLVYFVYQLLKGKL